MSKISKDVMKVVSQLSLEDELKKLSKINTENIVYQLLSDEQVDQLAEKIALLPLEYRNILFFRYCFNTTPSEIEEMLEIENSISKLRYIQKMLSGFMGLENSWIDSESMKKSCQIALVEDAKNYDNIIGLHQPNYSKDFRRRLKEIKIKRNFNRIFILVAKRVAIFILVVFLSFSAVLAVNAEAREKVFDWIIERFPKFSVFISEDIDENKELVELTSFTINYIPEEFELMDINEGRKMLIYNYLRKNNQKFEIKLFTSSGEGKAYYDTEGAEVKEIMVKGSQGYTWQTNEMNYLIWHQDGIEFHIVGNLNKDEILKVAKNILK
jgi:hypothetical protein